MLESLQMENFTVFTKADLKFGRNLNVIIGENGTGKSHILKLAYAAIAVRVRRAKGNRGEFRTKTQLQQDLADKLTGVFQPDHLGRLVHKAHGKSHVGFRFDDARLNIGFEFTRSAKTVNLLVRPNGVEFHVPVFLPTHELLSVYPGFVSLYETRDLPFEETWRDTCLLLGTPALRNPDVQGLLEPLETIMGGKVQLDRGRFYLRCPSARFEIHLVAEGFRKMATLAQLVATGSLSPGSYLFWDEPEANLNARIIRDVGRVILELCRHGIQVFVATHSLFLMRELYILQKREYVGLDVRYFGLHLEDTGTVSVGQGRTLDDIGDIAALDEELQQSDRYIDLEMGLPPAATSVGKEQ